MKKFLVYYEKNNRIFSKKFVVKNAEILVKRICRKEMIPAEDIIEIIEFPFHEIIGGMKEVRSFESGEGIA
jgi:hypothetical protein